MSATIHLKTEGNVCGEERHESPIRERKVDNCKNNLTAKRSEQVGNDYLKGLLGLDSSKRSCFKEP
jgi:hypothetical protein